MDNLPDHLIIQILSQLNDSTELARCKCVSKTLNSLARQVRSIHLYCSIDRYNKMRSPEVKVTPFKSILNKLISEAVVPIESVSFGLEKSLNCLINCYDDEDLEDDIDYLSLSDDDFTGEWLKKIGDRLKSISILDSGAQWFVRSSHFCDLVSFFCHNLVELELHNACVSVDDMHLMPLLTKLILKSVEIVDVGLDKLMECLPCLQVLNIIDDRGVTDPTIHHLNLKELKWTLCNYPNTFYCLSSLAIFAPNLTKLELDCEIPITISIHAPLLSYLDFAQKSIDELKVEKFKTLKTLRLESSELCCILPTFPSSTTVQNLTIELPKCHPLPDDQRIDLSDVFTIFPNVTALTLGSKVWSNLMVYSLEPSSPVAEGLRARLKQITVYLVLGDIDKTLTFISYVKGICSKLTDIVLFIHCDVDLSVASSFVSSCMSLCPKVRFRQGTWKERKKGCCFESSSVYV